MIRVFYVWGLSLILTLYLFLVQLQHLPMVWYLYYYPYGAITYKNEPLRVSKSITVHLYVNPPKNLKSWWWYSSVFCRWYKCFDGILAFHWGAGCLWNCLVEMTYLVVGELVVKDLNCWQSYMLSFTLLLSWCRIHVCASTSITFACGLLSLLCGG